MAINFHTFNDFDLNGPSSQDVVEKVEQGFGITLPPDYKTFVSRHDGGEGFIKAQYLEPVPKVHR